MDDAVSGEFSLNSVCSGRVSEIGLAGKSSGML